MLGPPENPGARRNDHHIRLQQCRPCPNRILFRRPPSTPSPSSTATTNSSAAQIWFSNLKSQICNPPSGSNCLTFPDPDEFHKPSSLSRLQKSPERGTSRPAARPTAPSRR